MKSLLCILVLSLTFHNCKTEEKSLADKFMESAGFLLYIDNFLYVNVCPTKNATLEKGTHTITLNEGEEYWFDVNTDSKPYDSYLKAYEVGVVEISGQTLTVGNPGCTRNKQIFEPSKAQAEGKEPNKYEDGFNVYVFFYRDGLSGIKSTSGSGKIKIKVP